MGSEKQDDPSSMYLSGVVEVTTPVFFLDNMQTGYVLEGPAMIIDKTQTFVFLLRPGSCGWANASDDELAASESKSHQNSSAFQPRGSVHSVSLLRP